MQPTLRALGALCLTLVVTAGAGAQTTSITTEYLMSVYLPLDPPQPIDSTLTIWKVREGGWVRGPRINGAMVTPTADWLRVTGPGIFNLDVRGTLKTDDGALIYVSYGGVVAWSPEGFGRLTSGQTIGPSDAYFLTAGTMRTSAPKYAWLNRVQTVGKMVALRAAPDSSYVKYDIFVVR